MPNGHRSIVVRSRRSAHDFPLPGAVVGRFRPSVTLDYFLAARTSIAVTPYFQGDNLVPVAEDSGALCGVLAIMPAGSGNAGAAAAHDLRTEIDTLIASSIAIAPSALTSDIPAEVVRKLVAGQASTACQIVRFVTFRTGETRIWLHINEFLGRDAATHRPTVPEQISIEAAPLQAYLFLKDTLHRHYHHDGQADQILIPCPLDLTASDKLKEDTKWRMATLRGLARVVVEYRQASTIISNKQALGILAYADAFQGTLARLVRRPDMGFDVNSDPITYDFDHMRASLESLDAIKESRRGLQLQLIAVLVGVFLSAAALWAGMVQIRPIICEPLVKSAAPCLPLDTASIRPAVDWTVSNPQAFIAFLMLVGFAAFIKFFDGLAAVPIAERAKREMRRIAIAVGASTAGRLSVRAGWYAALAIPGIIVLVAGAAAFYLIPKKVVPEHEPGAPRFSGKMAQLNRFEGKPTAETGLLIDSPISDDLRNLLGSSYVDFMKMYGTGGFVHRSGTLLWTTGTPSPRVGRDGAFFVVDQQDGRMEAAFRTAEHPEVFRTPGVAITKPAAIANALGWPLADAGPFQDAAPSCQTRTSGPDARSLILSGMLAEGAVCGYNISLRRGQRVAWTSKRFRGLAIDISAAEGSSTPLPNEYVAPHAGSYSLKVRWDSPAEKRILTTRPKAFYVRISVGGVDPSAL